MRGKGATERSQKAHPDGCAEKSRPAPDAWLERPGQDLNLRGLTASGFRDRRDTGLRDLGSDSPEESVSLKRSVPTCVRGNP